MRRYIDKEKVVSLLEGYSYQISQNSYEVDLANCNLIITNSFSTVFYDAMKIGIPVFRIENHGTFCDINFNSELVKSIRSKEEFFEAYKKLK